MGDQDQNMMGYSLNDAVYDRSFAAFFDFAGFIGFTGSTDSLICSLARPIIP